MSNSTILKSNAQAPKNILKSVVEPHLPDISALKYRPSPTDLLCSLTKLLQLKNYCLRLEAL